MSQLTTSSTVWNLLKGAVCLYKPSNYPLKRLKGQLKRRITQELNALASRERIGRFDGNDYSDHPLVLGDAFRPVDLEIDTFNDLQERQCGLVLATINDRPLLKRLKEAKWLCRYRVTAELGVATDTGFAADGKVLEKSRNPYVTEAKLAKVFSAVQSSHQRAAFDYAGVKLTSQAAYEIASSGPLRPSDLSRALIYSLQCLRFNYPEIEVEVSAVNEDEFFLSGLIGEIGFKLKTNAVCHKMRRVRFGPFGLQDVLLEKHFSLQHLLPHVNHAAALIDANKDQHATFKSPQRANDS